MSYQVLARKWRPKTFAELSGQEHVVAVLTNALAQKRLHHAYLFTGTRGVGKTTIARIFAKSLNCESGITVEPCGQCDACVDIDQGRFVDLLEIDAASRTKVDDTREILDNVQYAPTRGRYKVYLIDEVHMLSRSSFNALLKTLEEPPEHVKFILATTDPQKLPITVLSRCLQFHLKALTVKQISSKLEEILAAESVKVEPLALSLLAKAARGSMRDSLSLTDQAIAQGQGSINGDEVQQMLGGVDHHWVYKILIALIKQDQQGLMSLSLDIASYSPNFGRLLAELLQLLHQVAMNQIVDTHFDLTPEHNVLLEKFSKAMSPEDVQLYYQIVLQGRKDLPYAFDEQAAFDMVLLRMLAFKPQSRAAVIEHEKQDTLPEVNFSDVELADVKELEPSVAQQAETPIEKPAQGTIDTETQMNNGVEAPEKAQAEQVNEGKPYVEAQQHEVPPSAEINAVDEAIQDELTPVQNQNEQQRPQASVENVQEGVHQTNEHLVESGESLKQNNALEETIQSPIGKVIANRNMLRSQKQAMEGKEKKPSGAEERQQQIIKPEPPKDLPEIDSLPDEPFTEEEIDPSVIKKANQVDKWANMIDAMALNGRLRQLALNATISTETNDDKLVLELNQSTKHLRSDAAMQQLNDFVSDYFAKPTIVEVIVVEHTVDDPSQIQHKIDNKRYDYAKDVLKQDEIVVALEQQFDAVLDEDSIEAL